MSLSTILTGVTEGLLWALVALGVYVSFRVLDFADLTVEGSITTGASVVAILIVNKVDPFLATFIAVLAGAAAGFITGFLHAKLKIAPILAGILTMIALYSINIRIMGKSNINLGDEVTLVTTVVNLLGVKLIYARLIISAVFAVAVVALLYFFFGTKLGSVIRATGDNERMCRAQGVNTDNTKILGLMISNAAVALGGALIAQYQNYSNVNMGIGSIVIALAAVIIGETIFMRARSFWVKLAGVVLGSIVYRIILVIILNLNLMEASDLKILTAAMVAIALAIPTVKNLFQSYKKKRKNKHLMPEEISEAIANGGRSNSKMTKKRGGV